MVFRNRVLGQRWHCSEEDRRVAELLLQLQLECLNLMEPCLAGQELTLNHKPQMPNLKLSAVAFMSPQNHPILIKSFNKQHAIKYHYIAHTSLDVIEERGLPVLLRSLCTTNPRPFQIVLAAGKACDCYLGLLFSMEDVAVYGYITPLKVKIVIALPLSDSVVRDAETTMVRS